VAGRGLPGFRQLALDVTERPGERGRRGLVRRLTSAREAAQLTQHLLEQNRSHAIAQLGEFVTDRPRATPAAVVSRCDRC
jgi:hypothetical protein